MDDYPILTLGDGPPHRPDYDRWELMVPFRRRAEGVVEKGVGSGVRGLVSLRSVWDGRYQVE